MTQSSLGKKRGLTRPSLDRLEPYVCARDLYKTADVFLDANESPYRMDGVLDLKNDVLLNRYPDSDATQLVQALADYSNVSAENVLVGNGSDEIISLTINAIAAAGDNLVTVQPGYSMYGVCANILGVEDRAVTLTENFDLDVDAILKSVDNCTRGIFFPNPNSAAGTSMDENDIRTLLESFDGLVFVDEAYAEFSGETVIPLLGTYENLVVSRTMSKAWSLAGLRVGYALGNPGLIKALRRIKPPYNVSTLSQRLATQALKMDRLVMQQNVEETRRLRQRLFDALRTRGLTVYPSVANFVLVRFPPGVDSKKVQQALAMQRIIVRDRSTLPLLDNCTRVTVGNAAETDLLLERLDRVLERIGT